MSDTPSFLIGLALGAALALFLCVSDMAETVDNRLMDVCRMNNIKIENCILDIRKGK